MNRTNLKIVLRLLVVTAFISTILAYTYIKARNLINGPQISITEPQDGSTNIEQLTFVRGQASNVTFISLNDRPIFIDEKGGFNEIVLLSGGYNILTLRARDKFGREISKKIEMVYNGE